MDHQIGTDAEVGKLVAAALAGELTDQRAEALAGLSPELLSLVVLAASKRIAELESKLKVTALTAWLHYGLGVTISQVIALSGHLLQTRLSADSLDSRADGTSGLADSTGFSVASSRRAGGLGSHGLSPVKRTERVSIAQFSSDDSLDVLFPGQ